MILFIGGEWDGRFFQTTHEQIILTDFELKSVYTVPATFFEEFCV